MNFGIMWYDNQNKSMLEVIKNAREQYKRKFNQLPTHCEIHPTDLARLSVEELASANAELGLTVEGKNNILKNIVYIGKSI